MFVVTGDDGKNIKDVRCAHEEISDTVRRLLEEGFTKVTVVRSKEKNAN